MCRLSRQNGGWEFKALGIGTEGESADDLTDEIQALN
jgi:stress response protein SCP2